MVYKTRIVQTLYMIREYAYKRTVRTGYQKDIKQNQKYYKDRFQTGLRERKNTVHCLVEKIIQGNE